MTTQYTPILKLALPVTGELSGTWGDVVNDNITSMVEQAVAGLATINTWTTNAHTLTTANGTSSEARCAMLVLATGSGGTALTAAGEVICPAASKLYVVKNGSAYAVTLKTSGGTGVAVPAGDTAFLFCDGTNVSACVTTIVNGHISGNLTVDGNTTLGDAATDTITATAQFNTDLLPSTDNARDLGSTAKSWRTLYCETSVIAANITISGNTISSTDTNGNITLAPNGTGDVQLDADTIRVGDSGTNVTITSNGAGDLILNTNSGTNSGSITIEDGANGNITVATNGTGDVYLDADTVRIGDSNANATLTTNGTGDLILNTNAGTNSGSITIADGANGNITISTNGTGITTMTTAVEMSATTQNIALGTSQTSGTFTVGGASQTGNITLDQSTKAHTLNIGTGATENATTKTINIGTGGVSGSTTTITIGSSNGTTTTFNGTVNVTTLDLTNLEVTNIKAKDGTASITLADSTGVATFSANPILNAGTANGVVYLNASKVATTGTALTYNANGLGIGVAAASRLLDIQNDQNAASQARIRNDNNGTASQSSWSVSYGDFAQYLSMAQYSPSFTTSGLRIASSAGLFTAGNSNGLRIYTIDAAPVIFGVSDSEKMRLGSAVGGVGALGIGYSTLTSVGDSGLAVLGNVGIGTSAPVNGLSVLKYGTQWTGHTTNTYPQPAGNVFFQMQAVANTDNWFGMTGNYGATTGSANFLLQANLNNVNQQAGHYIASQVISAIAADLTFGKMIGGATTGANSAKSEFMRLTSTGTLNIVGAGTAGSTQAISFNGSTPVDTLVTTSTGVGIGTNAPAYKLDVSTTSGDTQAAVYDRSSGSSAARFDLRTSGTGASQWYIQTGNTTSGLNGSLRFYDQTNNLERMRLDSSGNLGIGTNAPVSKLQVTDANKVFDTYGNLNVYTSDTATVGAGGAIGFGGNNGTGGTSPYVFAKIQGIKEGATNTWNGALLFGTTAGSSAVIERARITSTGEFQWKPDGTTQAMTLDASGDLIIGDTNTNGIRLSIVKNNPTRGILAHIYNIATSGQTGAQIQFTQSAIDNWAVGQPAGENAFAFWSSRNTAADGTERMRITSGGDLLVGTTSGNVGSYGKAISLAATASTYAGLEISGTTGGALEFQTSQSTRQVQLLGNSSGFLIYSNGGSGLAERARITSGGYFKAQGTSTYFSSSGLYHELIAAEASDPVVVVYNKNGSFTGNMIQGYSDRTPSAGTYRWINFQNGGVTRFQVLDTGDCQNANNSYAGTSDEKLKQDIVDSGSQWDDVKNLRVRKFRFKSDPDGQMQIGLVAQEVETVSPGLVIDTPDYETVEVQAVDADGNLVMDADGNPVMDRKHQPTGSSTKAVKYSVLYMKSVKALQEAMARIETLEAKIAVLESKGV